MLSTFPIAVIVGTILGILSGLGTGGGSLLMIWLTLIQNTAQEEARAINLLFFVPSALIACLFRIKQNRLQIKKVLPAIIAGSISAAIFALFVGQWDTSILKKAFGFLLIATGIRELSYKSKTS